MNGGETPRFFKLALKISGYVGSSPYTRSDARRVEFGGRKSKRYFAFLAQVVLQIAYESFVFTRWIQISYFDPNATVAQRIGMQYTALCGLIPIIQLLFVVYYTEQFSLLISRILRYNVGAGREF